MAKLSGNNSTTSLITLIKNEIKNIMNLLNGKSSTSHNHDSVYSKLSHTHDDRYYTESEINTKLSGKSNTSHKHYTNRFISDNGLQTYVGNKIFEKPYASNDESAGISTSGRHIVLECQRGNDSGIPTVLNLNTYGPMVNGRLLYSSFFPSQLTDLGLDSSPYHWEDIYSTNAPSQTSDRNEKNTIEDIDINRALNFILGLIPKTYKMNTGRSGRIHWGLISQDIEELLEQLGMTSLDFAGLIKSPNENYAKETIKTINYDENGKEIEKEVPNENKDREFFYSLRYDEFIAPIIKVIQYLYHENQNKDKRIDTLEHKVESLESRLETIEKLINIAK